VWEYYRARYYDPQIGRFISEDPSDFGGGVNFYDYVGNNAVNLIDPTGLSGSRPGGPYHPPNGVHTKCLPTDSCSALSGKMWVLQRMIASHTVWDYIMPKPRGGNRHQPEISDLWVQLGQCINLYFKNCKNNCTPPPAPAPEPKWWQKPFQGPFWDRVRDWQRDVEDDIRRGPRQQPGPVGPPPIPWWVVAPA
jgi:hypothetical protein